MSTPYPGESDFTVMNDEVERHKGVTTTTVSSRTSDGRTMDGTSQTPGNSATATAARHTHGSGGLALRAGRGDEAPALSELALRSKGWWGYSPSFLEACRAELTLDQATAEHTRVVEVDGRLAGFYLLTPVKAGRAPGRGELSMLFVDPEFIGSGVGRVLAEDARRVAGAQGWTHLLIASDPQAVDFYVRMGAEQIGEQLSESIPGRSLPLLELPVRRTTGVGGARATYWR